MSDHFERYHCQMALPGFGERSQQLLQNARVLIVGAGGLGCPTSQYLAAAGIGTIGIVDDDIVSLGNLHRQILFTPEDVGKPKVMVASEKLHHQNPDIEVIPFDQRVISTNVMELIADFDLVIEGTDNFETKYLLNDACVLADKPLIYGAIYQYEGQVSIWNVLQEDGAYSANYRDAFPNAEKATVPNCVDGGVIPTLAGIVGCIQANEAIKYVTNSANLLTEKLWMINVQTGNTRIINLKKNPGTSITKLPESVATITFDEVKKKYGPENYELIDVRTKAEHRAFNMGGKNVPVETLEGRMDTLSFNKPVVCYCSSGRRSAAAARMIKSRYPQTKIYSLKDDIEQVQK